MTGHAPILITTTRAFEELCARLRDEPRIGMDTEADSLYSYYEKVCLIQFSIPGGDYILDTLSVRELAPLGALCADPRVELVFHAAEYDILLLKRDFGFTFESIFDTMVAARILGWKQVGLGAILEERFGVKLDKRFQRADWGKRPLTRELLEYARDDTHYLIPLRDLEAQALEAAGRMPEARAEFARLTRVTWGEREFDPHRYYALPGARDLDPPSLGALRELYQLREELARQADRPPFKVLSNAALVRLAHLMPRHPSELTAIPGVGTWFARRYGREALKAIARGAAHPQTRPPRPARRSTGLHDPAARERYSQLKEWRRARAAARGVEPDVIISNDALEELARVNPQTQEALDALRTLDEWKRQEYGDELLGILRSKTT